MPTVLAELNRVVGALPADKAKEVLDFAQTLVQRLSTDESDDWSDEDLRECTIASMERFEEEHGDEDWGGLIDDRGGDNVQPR